MCYKHALARVQASFQQQVRKQMCDTAVRQSPTETADGAQLMEQLRSDDDHKCATRISHDTLDFGLCCWLSRRRCMAAVRTSTGDPESPVS